MYIVYESGQTLNVTLASPPRNEFGPPDFLQNNVMVAYQSENMATGISTAIGKLSNCVDVVETYFNSFPRSASLSTLSSVSHCLYFFFDVFHAFQFPTTHPTCFDNASFILHLAVLPALIDG